MKEKKKVVVVVVGSPPRQEAAAGTTTLDPLSSIPSHYFFLTFAPSPLIFSGLPSTSSLSFGRDPPPLFFLRL